MGKRPKNTYLNLYRAKLKKLGPRPAIVVETAEGRETVSFQALLDRGTACARALLALGLELGETTTVWGQDHAEWLVFHQGALLAGGWVRSVPSLAGVRGNTWNRITFVQDGPTWVDVLESGKGEPASVEHLIVLRDVEGAQDPRAMSWDDFIARGLALPAGTLEDRQQALPDVQVAMRKNQWEPTAAHPGARATRTRELQRLG